jgi:CheY-like chemotaxis protein
MHERKKTLNILLADDDTDDCIFFKETLDDLQLSTNITTVHDGEQLMLLLTGEKYMLPDILFLDINMPRKNGFECLIEIKQHPSLKEIPVVIFSTSYEQEMVNLLYENGAQYFIRKPSEFAIFKKIILHTLTLIEAENIVQPTRGEFVITVGNSFVI